MVTPPVTLIGPNFALAGFKITQLAQPIVGFVPPELVIGALAATPATPLSPSLAMPCDAAIVTFAVPVLLPPPVTVSDDSPAHATNESPLPVMLVLVVESLA